MPLLVIGSTPLPRLAGVTNLRQRWFGASTTWSRVRLTLGFDARAANRAIKSTGLKATWVGVYDIQLGRRLMTKSSRIQPRGWIRRMFPGRAG